MITPSETSVAGLRPPVGGKRRKWASQHERLETDQMMAGNGTHPHRDGSLGLDGCRRQAGSFVARGQSRRERGRDELRRGTPPVGGSEGHKSDRVRGGPRRSRHPTERNRRTVDRRVGRFTDTERSAGKGEPEDAAPSGVGGGNRRPRRSVQKGTKGRTQDWGSPQTLGATAGGVLTHGKQPSERSGGLR